MSDKGLTGEFISYLLSDDNALWLTRLSEADEDMFEERAAIFEFDCGMSRAEAEIAAYKEMKELYPKSNGERIINV